VGNWCVHHGCSVCESFFFSFLSFPPFTPNFVTWYIQWADTALAHVSCNPTSIYTAMFCVYLLQTNKQTSWWLSVTIHYCNFLSATGRHRMNNQWIAFWSVVTLYRIIRLGRMSHGGKKLMINCGKKHEFILRTLLSFDSSHKMNFCFKFFALSLSL